MPTRADYRRHYEDFTADIIKLCTDRAVRRDLQDGRGRPVKECTRMHRYLTVRTTGHGHRRAHYTLASLIALTDPLQELRTRPTPPLPPSNPAEPTAVPSPSDSALRSEPATAPTGLQTAPSGESDTTPAGDASESEQPDPYATAVWRKRPNLGTTLARAVRKARFDEDRTDDLLHVIVHVDDDHLHQHILPSLIDRLLRAGLVPDWPVLLDDLAHRVFDPDDVATRWLDAFYLTLNPPKDRT
ncbi:type I-E CRISPR-associated protein Cse2/CasB [Streptomyces sp. NBC_01262]|uniref:type I-E CRISPR-associated protein Cse2/CasB n=1 Tax=Streptomyces sp. NBC_01262 TaxID=2903803 RepID=UPI002E343196|nr:type I-E CRISPR-associated protein Cse2/CasB [Streptomyces sp. NBC_01262]